MSKGVLRGLDLGMEDQSHSKGALIEKKVMTSQLAHNRREFPNMIVRHLDSSQP